MKKVSWQEVAYPHAWIGSIDKMRDLSAQLGYTMFCWNSRIYNTKDGSSTSILFEDVQ